MRTRGRKASIGITMDRDLIERLDAIEVGGTKRLPRSTKISLIVEQYIREHSEGVAEEKCFDEKVKGFPDVT